MNVYLVVMNDGVNFRTEEVWFNEGLAIESASGKGESHIVVEFKTEDLPPGVGGFNTVKEMHISDFNTRKEDRKWQQVKPYGTSMY